MAARAESGAAAVAAGSAEETAGAAAREERTGRDGRLRLRFVRRGAQTVLSECACRAPLLAQRAAARGDGAALLYLLNAGGGIVGGDDLRTVIELEAGGRATISTPAATQVYPGAGAAASAQTWIRLGPGARLEYRPEPVVPHRGVTARQAVEIEMAPGSTALVWDALAAGRIAYGERWAFRRFENSLRARVGGVPVYGERTRIEPEGLSPRQAFRMGEYGYLCALLALGDEERGWAELAETWRAILAAHGGGGGGAERSGQGGGVWGGVGLPSRGGCVARYVCADAPAMRAVTEEMLSLARGR